MLKAFIVTLSLWCGSALALQQGLHTSAPIEGDRVPIASLTKMMTALIAVDQDPNERIVILQDDADVIKHTKSRLKNGTSYRRDELIQLALVASENKAALALSRSFPGGRTAFVAEMNSRAALYGMNASFTDPAGLGYTNEASMRAIYLLGDKLYESEHLRQISVTRSLTLNKTTWSSTNAFVRAGHPPLAQKTGYTREAGSCLFMKTDTGTVVILGAKNRYLQLKQLLGNR